MRYRRSTICDRGNFNRSATEEFVKDVANSIENEYEQYQEYCGAVEEDGYHDPPQVAMNCRYMAAKTLCFYNLLNLLRERFDLVNSSEEYKILLNLELSGVAVNNASRPPEDLYSISERDSSEVSRRRVYEFDWMGSF